jgi:hypothetical protein
MVTLVLLLSATAIVACGSSATTSPADAKKIGVAEHEFSMGIRRAVIDAKAQCSKKKGQAAEICLQRLVFRGEAKPTVAFETAVKRVLESGVGPECAESLEEALSTISSVPLFPGGTASVCLAESRH